MTYKWYLYTALFFLFSALSFGVLASYVYISPEFLKQGLGFTALRPIHVSSVLLWILLGATGSVYAAMESLSEKKATTSLLSLQWLLWMVAAAGILYSYLNKSFGGREYWEFNPVWALPIGAAWVIFVMNFVRLVKSITTWPVYVWMWLTGIVFFLFIFSENYLWLFPFFKGNLLRDMTIQWKVNGSMVGAWNQMIYGSAFFLMDRIAGTKSTGRSKVAFFMYFLGLFNLMFNWGHHIYTLPTEKYVRHLGYAVSMTEWIIFIKILYDWKKAVDVAHQQAHHFSYRFLLAADVWVFLNLFQALLMSIPAVNRLTHGTHVTVAHAMGTTIGINSMILISACFEFLGYREKMNRPWKKLLTFSFWLLQGSLFLFWLSLNSAGIQKGLWQLSPEQGSYSGMMEGLQLWFRLLVLSGIGLLMAFSVLIVFLLKKNPVQAGGTD
ncbi:MAG TPA: cbb3-type cytochrome c oxidase subunit I [Bacteroidia bacterium]|nr:cbb3-type cytochrome c oxidase subunit I [Bacteroidia bacterium]